jgi:hypothetical protein
MKSAHFRFNDGNILAFFLSIGLSFGLKNVRQRKTAELMVLMGKLGIQQRHFPAFIPHAFLEREIDHVKELQSECLSQKNKGKDVEWNTEI